MLCLHFFGLPSYMVDMCKSIIKIKITNIYIYIYIYQSLAGLFLSLSKRHAEHRYGAIMWWTEPETFGS